MSLFAERRISPLYVYKFKIIIVFCNTYTETTQRRLCPCVIVNLILYLSLCCGFFFYFFTLKHNKYVLLYEECYIYYYSDFYNQGINIVYSSENCMI